MKKSFWLIALFSSCLFLQAAPSHAQSYKEDGESTMDRWERERKEEKAKENNSAYCGGLGCHKQDDADIGTPSVHQLENSFQQQGTKKGSIGGIMADQLQPR